MESLIDRQLLIRRKRRALTGSRPPADFLLANAVEELNDRLSLIERRFPRAASLFEGSGLGSAMLSASGKIHSIRRIEMDESLLGDAEGIVEPREEVPLAPESVNLIVSLLALHAVNDLPGFLVQIRRALLPDGLFIGAFAGAGTLRELRESLLAAEAAHTSGASPRIYPFADVRSAGNLIQRAGFALPVVDAQCLTVRYDSMFGLMADLRAMGETSALHARSRRPLSRKVLAAAADYYSDNFADPDGRIPASFNILWLSGWAPDPSQQKPLRPGSAKMPLTQALSALDPPGSAPSL